MSQTVRWAPTTPRDLLFDLCSSKGWSEPELIFESRGTTQHPLYSAVITVTTPGARFTTRGAPNGWKYATMRWAALDAIRLIDPSQEFPAAWSEVRDIRFEAIMDLLGICKQKGWGEPVTHSAEPTQGPWPNRCVLQIRELERGRFVGEGIGVGEAKAVAATQALAFLDQPSNLSAPAPEEPTPLVSENFLAFMRRRGRDEPASWVEELCRNRNWPAPDFVIHRRGVEPHLIFHGATTIRVNGTPESIIGLESPIQNAARRNVAFEFLRRAAPDIQLPPEVQPRAMEVNPLVEVNNLGQAMGLGELVSKVDVRDTEYPNMVAVLKFKGYPTSWTGAGFCNREAKAWAAAKALPELRALVAQKNAPKPAPAAPKIMSVPSRPIPRAPAWLMETDKALRAALPFLGPKHKLSPHKEDRAEWDLRLPSQMVLTLNGAERGTVGLMRARDAGGAEVSLPVRVKGRVLSISVTANLLANSLRSLFIESLERKLPTPLAPASPPPAAAGAPTQTSALTWTPVTPKLRPEIEADPHVKAASPFFRDGFLAYCDGAGEENPWLFETVRRVQWHLGHDYARLCCSKCGAKNTQGARCAMPELPEDPAPQEMPLFDRMRAALERMRGDSRLLSAQQLEDLEVLREGADLLERLMPPPEREERPLPPALCLKCVRMNEPARGQLFLNINLAQARLRDLESEQLGTPYRTVKLYGLRQRAKKNEFWAYAIVTNGTLGQCREEELVPYRDLAVPLEPGDLNQLAKEALLRRPGRL